VGYARAFAGARPEYLRIARLTPPRGLTEHVRRPWQPPLSHFGRPSVAPSLVAHRPCEPAWGMPWTIFIRSISRCSLAALLPPRLSPASPDLRSRSSR